LENLSDQQIIDAAGDHPDAQDLPDLLRQARDLLAGEAVKRASQS
jgi:hypothetical protein